MFLTPWSARDGFGWLAASRAAPVALHAEVFLLLPPSRSETSDGRHCRKTVLSMQHWLSGSRRGFDSIDRRGAKVGPGFVYWIARVTPDCMLDASIEITIGTEGPDCAFAGIRTWI
jgi:hypothetical protein